VSFLRKGVALLILLLSLAVFQTRVEQTLSMFEFDGQAIEERDAILPELRAERGGERVLPAKVLTMIALLRTARIERFRQSSGIGADPDSSVPQRLAEGAYPIRLQEKAPHVIAFENEALDAACVVVARREGIVLARCP
jgi:hypothetical protein